ncbi:M28 family metallopeptidase [Novosphingobium sp. FKTRR1]|uniref:M28 family metallopeptidase n=1 Tax=Novosphingobium sp. FKTRR1 TaxID=2879118 RepID=UPI001CF0BD1E|nr:M28 family peptidase [Novosphingobium sp. FKTRR1]
MSRGGQRPGGGALALALGVRRAIGICLAFWLALGASTVPVSADAALRSPTSVQRREGTLESALRQHVETLASDEYLGREPGTDGETRTLRYLARQWFDIGLQSGTNDPGNAWFAPVVLVERVPLGSRAQFFHARKRLALADAETFVVTSGLRSLIENAPLVYVGKSTNIAIARTELAGRIAVVLDSQSDIRIDKAAGDRAGRLLDAGASAVITVLDGDIGLDGVIARRSRAGYALANQRLGGDIEAFLTVHAAEALLASGGAGSLADLRRAGEARDFSPRLLGISGTLEATSRETRINTHNLIGRIEGRKPETGAVLLVAHWDHFGKCASPPAEHLICNGAVDNASGLAVITEVARTLALGRQLDRDVYFLASTGEELGLLGAQAFAENPPVPLDRIVAVLNVDSTGIVPAGLPVSVIGKGMTNLDEHIARVLKAMKRKIVPGDAANAYVRRQDGWVFIQHDVPAVMVSSAYSDPERLERFMDDRYHRTADVADKVEYGGMAEDVQVQVELVRYLADLKRYIGPPLPIDEGKQTASGTP